MAAASFYAFRERPQPSGSSSRFFFLGATYNGSTTLRRQHSIRPLNIPTLRSRNASYLGEIFGLEADFAHAPSFFPARRPARQ